jgi:hypothetical protein
MGFLGGALGTKNEFKADKAQLDKSQYGGTIQGAQAGAADNTKFNNVFGQQQGVVDQYGQVAQGKGPNPALNMMRQQAGQNVNMAQGQAASQRGVNPALAARMAVDAAGQSNQQTAGQGATLQAQQSLAAMGQQAGALGQMQQGALGQQAAQTNLLGVTSGAQNQQNNAEIANTLGTNQINAGVASQNAATNAAMVGGLMNAAGGVAAMSDERVKTDIHRQQTEALPGVPEATFRYKGLPGQWRGVIAQDVQEERPDLVAEGPDGYLRVDPSLAPEKMARGGLIPGYTDGGMVPQAEMPELAGLAQGGFAPEPTSPLHGYLDSLEAQVQPAPQGFAEGGMAQPNIMPSFGTEPLQAPTMRPQLSMPQPMDLGQPTPASAVAGREQIDFLDPNMNPQAEPPGSGSRPGIGSAFSDLKNVGTGAYDRFARMGMPVGLHLAAGGPVPMNFVGGGHVPGQAQVQGDSGKNDIVPALLSPGEAVIPRSVMQSQNPATEAAAFVEHLLRRRGGPSFDKAMAARGARKMAGGGEVKAGGAGSPDVGPSLTDAVSGWWQSRGTPEQEQHGRNVDEALNALLPSMVSGRKALQTKRENLKKVDAASKD